MNSHLSPDKSNSFSVASDTVNHAILLGHLEEEVGVFHMVQIISHGSDPDATGNELSSTWDLSFEIPQDTILSLDFSVSLCLPNSFQSPYLYC